MPADLKFKSSDVRVYVCGEEIGLVIRPSHAKAIMWLLRWVRIPALADVHDGLRQVLEVQDGKG